MKKNSLLQEFKSFVMRGNVLDLAVGVIIANAFGKITSSLVNDVIMPAIGMIIGKVDLSKLNIVLKKAEDPANNVSIGIGTFITTIIDFIIVSFVIFLVVKFVNNITKKTEELINKNKEEPVEEKADVKTVNTTDEILNSILEEIKALKESK